LKIDRKLNLVLTVEREDGGEAHVHATPIDMETFERYFLTISQTYSELLARGGEYMLRQGPQVAKFMLRRVAEKEGNWDGPEGVERGLMAEIRRLANVMVPTETGGWEMVPLQEALDRKYFEPSDATEVENAITFFTVCWHAMRRRDATEMLPTVFGLLGGSITSSDATAFLGSLPTSRTGANTGEKVTASSIPR